MECYTACALEPLLHQANMPRLLTIGILLATSTAYAQDAPRLAVVGLHQSEVNAEAQEQLVSDLVEAVDATGKADGLDTEEFVVAITGREEIILKQALLGAGQDALTNGKNLYNQAQTEDAIYELQVAVEQLGMAVGATNTTTDLWEAWVYLATAHLTSDDQEAADIGFRSAAALNSSRVPNGAIFPPNVVEAYETARDALKGQAITLNIAADAEATVFVDGTEVGPSPAAVDGLLPGIHHIVAKGDGTQAYKLLMVKPSAEAQTLKLGLGAPNIAQSSASSPGRSRQAAQLYRAIGSNARDLDLILLAGTDDGLLHLQLYAPSNDAFSKAMSIPFADTANDEAAQTIPLLMNFVDATGRISDANTSPLAVPLHLDSNVHLSSLLLDPREVKPVVITNNEIGAAVVTKRSPVVPILISILAASAAGTGGYLGYSALTNDAPKYDGNVVIGPLAR